MDVSVVIVSFNAKEMMAKCLESIFKFTKDVSFEVIVVDNASTDGVTEYLKEISHSSMVTRNNFKLIESKENLGFAKGNNLGIKEAKGRYVFFLNNDTELVENSLERLKVWMDAHADVAVVSSQMLSSEQKLSPTGGFFPSLKKVFAWAFFLDDVPFLQFYGSSYHPHSSKMYEKEFFPDWVTGSIFFVRKEAINQVGNFDDNMFMYGEELEWCMRFKKAGWKIGYTPITKIIHHERGSQGGLPKGAVLGEFRGLKYIYGKYEPIWKQLVLGTILDLAAFLRVLMWLVRLKPLMAKVYLEALFL